MECHFGETDHAAEAKRRRDRAESAKPIARPKARGQSPSQARRARHRRCRVTPSPFPRPFPWQQVAWHERRSYWELAEEDRRDLRESLELEAASLARHTDRSLEDYANSPGTLDGQLVNGDVLAILLPSLRRNPTQGYEALEDPAGRAAVHLNFLGKHLRDRALAHARGEPAMIFMGGQATGKTTGALALGPAFGAVFDAPHTDPEGVAFLLGRIRRAGCGEIHLAYTDRDPEGSLKAMLARSEREGRYVPLDRMARAHAWAPFTFLGLAQRVGRSLQLYHVQVDETGPGRMAEGQDALASVRARPSRSVTRGVQPSLAFALLASPHRWSTSVGR